VKPPTAGTVDWKSAFPRVNGLAIGCAGGTLFELAGFPAGWLCGAIIATTLAGAFGIRIESASILRWFALALLGTVVGSKVTPQLLHDVAALPLSLVFLAAAVLLGHRLNQLLLERVAGWDRRTSRYSAVPGSLFVLLGVIDQLRVDNARLVGVHLVRLFVIAVSFPLFAAWIGDGGVPTPVAARGAAPPHLLVLLLSLAGSILLHRLRVPAGALLGALLPSATLHGFGLAATPVVQPVLVLCYLVLGIHVGSQMQLIERLPLREVLSFGLGTAGIAIGTAASVAWIASIVLDQPFGQLLFSYAPGGMEVMTMLSIVFHFDPGLTAAHQLTRYFAFILLLPWMLRRD